METNKKIYLFLGKLQIILFFLLIFLLVLKYTPILENLNLSMLPGLLKIFLGFLFLISFLLVRHPVKVWINFIAFLLIIGCVTVFSREFNLLIYVFMIFGIQKESIKSFIIAGYYALIFSCILVCILYFTGVLPNTTVYRLGELRNTLGFNLPVTLPSFLFSITSIFVYLNYNKISILNILPLLLINSIVFIYTNGRTGFFFSIVLLIGPLFLRLLNNKYGLRILFYLNLYGLLIANAVSIFAAIFFTNSNGILSSIDKILTGRIYWWNLYWNTYSINLFGQQILRISSEARLKDSFSQIMILDNTYLSILIEYGVLLYFIIIFLLIKLFSNLRDLKHSSLLWILFVNILIGVSGNSLLYLETNVFLLIFVFLVDSRGDEPVFE